MNIKEYNKSYYGRNIENRKRQILNRQNLIRDSIREYKLTKGCSICGYKKSARALQFHHTKDDTKSNDISRMVAQGRSLNSIYLEVEKCIVLCANCHSELHDI